MSQPSTQSLRDAIDELEAEHCLCGARKMHRNRPSWEYCGIHRRTDAIRALLPSLESALGERQGQPAPDALSTRQIASKIFFHCLLKGEKGNPFHGMNSDWFIDLVTPKLDELFLELAARPSPAAPTERQGHDLITEYRTAIASKDTPAAPDERLRGPLSLEMVQGAIKQATTINPLHNYVRYIDEQKLRDILNDALTAHEARTVAQARVDEAKLAIHNTAAHTTGGQFPLPSDITLACPTCRRIADLERDLAAIASGKEPVK